MLEAKLLRAADPMQGVELRQVPGLRAGYFSSLPPPDRAHLSTNQLGVLLLRQPKRHPQADQETVGRPWSHQPFLPRAGARTVALKLPFPKRPPVLLPVLPLTKIAGSSGDWLVAELSEWPFWSLIIAALNCLD